MFMLSCVSLFSAFFSKTVSGKSHSTYTYCYNYTECENETISTTYASCYGYYGCDGSDIESEYTLAYGELGCYGSEINSEYIYGYGHYGTYGAAISTLDLFGYGYETSRVADIEPYSTELNIYFYGYYAGYASDVSCYSGDTCHLYCGSSKGCYKVDFYCYSGATCYYDCSSDDVCPTSYSGVDSDLTYVTSAGISSATTLSAAMTGSDTNYVQADSGAVLYTQLTDEQISEYKRLNQIAKDKSKRKLEQDTVYDTNLQKQMTYDQEFRYSDAVAKSQRDREAEREEEQERQDRERQHENEKEQYAIMQSLKNYKHGGNGNILIDITLEEYSVAFIIDIVIIAAAIKMYNYCNKIKGYQSI